MTKKERKKVYLEAYKQITKDFPKGNTYGCCSKIARLVLNDPFKYKEIPKIAPEFELFNPHSEKYGLLWFEMGNLEERQTALLLAAEMCN